MTIDQMPDFRTPSAGRHSGTAYRDVPRQQIEKKLSPAQLRALGNLCRGNAHLIGGRWRFRGCSESFAPATIDGLRQAGFASGDNASAATCVRITKLGRAQYRQHQHVEACQKPQES